MSNGLIEKLAAEPIIHNGERCITHDIGDQLHGRPEGTFRKSFNRNRSKFTEGKHYYSMPLKEFRELRPSNGRNPEGGNPNVEVVLLTEKGYLMVIKPMGDDVSWEVQEQLIDGYFRLKDAATSKALTPAEALLAQCVLMVEHERRLAAIEADVAVIKTRAEDALLELRAADPPETSVPAKTMRAKVNEVVRAWCTARGAEYSETWGVLYRELYSRCQFDARRRSRNSGCSQLDAVEAKGLMSDLYTIAYEKLKLE